MKHLKLLHIAGIVIGLVVIAACVPMPTPTVQGPPTTIPAATATPPPVVTPAATPAPLPTDEQECLKQGGTWGPQGMAGTDMCDLPTTDAGLPCTDSSQCEGVCLAGSTPSVGACSPRRLNFGCFGIMKDGEQLMLCID